jgi:hypothetical protein
MEAEMSKIALSPNASGSAVFTLAAPNSNSDRTLTLPDNTGTILTNATTAGFPAGSVLQVVSTTYSTLATSSSSTYADTGLTASITPTSATSKILVLVNQAGCGKETNNTNLNLKLVRGATDLIEFEKIGGYVNANTANYFGSCSTCYLDSPATTSSTTYKTQFASRANNATVYLQSAFTGTGSVSTITLMEIAA